MDDKTKELLFERYYRGTNTEESNIGTGLGLAITKQLVHAHNGAISIDSELGKERRLYLCFRSVRRKGAMWRLFFFYFGRVQRYMKLYRRFLNISAQLELYQRFSRYIGATQIISAIF